MNRRIVLRVAQAGVIGLSAWLWPSSADERGFGGSELLIILAIIGVVVSASKLPAIVERMSNE